MELRRFTSSEAQGDDLGAIRRLMNRAFDGRFTNEDWAHSIGGWHVVAIERDSIVAHASLVTRLIDVGGTRFDSGYVEAVATEPSRQGLGMGTAVMGAVADLISTRHTLGALSTGEHHFYERLGWERWQGPSFVRDGTQLIRTEDEDDGIMVLRFGRSTGIDLTSSISCLTRIGDDW